MDEYGTRVAQPLTSGAAGPSHGVLRWLRAGAVAGTVLGLAAGAHLAAGGRLPGPVLLLAVAVVLVACSLLLAGRRFGRPVLTALVGGGQVVLHGLFDACATRTAAVAPQRHDHHDEWVPLVDAASGASSPSVAMTLAHVAATVLATVLLLHGERLLWTLCAWLRPVVRIRILLVRFVAARPVPLPDLTTPRPRSVVARRVRRRGPPGVPAPATTCRPT